MSEHSKKSRSKKTKKSKVHETMSSASITGPSEIPSLEIPSSSQIGAGSSQSPNTIQTSSQGTITSSRSSSMAVDQNASTTTWTPIPRDGFDPTGIRLVSLIDMKAEIMPESKWNAKRQLKKPHCLKTVSYLTANSIKPNMDVTIDGVVFHCHLTVLNSYTAFFFFTEEHFEFGYHLPKEEVSVSAFKKIYDWMLTDAPIVEREGVLEIFKAANFLKIQELISQCWKCLEDTQLFREDTAYIMYIQARYANLEQLEHLMLSRVFRFFLPLVASQQFLDLSCFEVCQLLSSNNIGINTEVEVFMAAIRWLDYNWANRQQHQIIVTKNVRFSSMPAWFLASCNKQTGFPEVDRITHHPEIKTLINEGLSYATTNLYFNRAEPGFQRFLEQYKLHDPVPRQWIYDRRCFYHHLVGCTEMTHLTYDAFLDYLDQIRIVGRDYWTTLESAKTITDTFKCCLKYGKPQMPPMIMKRLM